MSSTFSDDAFKCSGVIKTGWFDDTRNIWGLKIGAITIRDWFWIFLPISLKIVNSKSSWNTLLLFCMRFQPWRRNEQTSKLF